MHFAFVEQYVDTDPKNAFLIPPNPRVPHTNISIFILSTKSHNSSPIVFVFTLADDSTNNAVSWIYIFRKCVIHSFIHSLSN